jgi:hypothetical protein
LRTLATYSLPSCHRSFALPGGRDFTLAFGGLFHADGGLMGRLQSSAAVEAADNCGGGRACADAHPENAAWLRAASTPATSCPAILHPLCAVSSADGGSGDSDGGEEVTISPGVDIAVRPRVRWARRSCCSCCCCCAVLLKEESVLFL